MVAPPYDIDRDLRKISSVKKEDIKLSINGILNSHQKKFLKLQLQLLDNLLLHLETIQIEIQQASSKFVEEINLLDTIPEIAVTSATAIIAEIGIDMDKFPTAEHFCSWAGLCPGNNESAGVKKNSRITFGNTYIKGLICECAWSTVRSRECYLSKFYWKIKQRRGAKKAVIALSRKIMVIIFNILKNKTIYDENKFQIAKDKQQSIKNRKLESDAKKLGFELVPIKTA